MQWILLVVSLPTENATLRMRVWRALKGMGAANLRDGAYLLPNLPGLPTLEAQLQLLADEVIGANGSAHVLRLAAQPDNEGFVPLFDRSADYADLIHHINSSSAQLTSANARESTKLARKHRKALAGLVEIDYFPGEAMRQTDAALQALDLACNQALSPDEPRFAHGQIAPLNARNFQNRTWATRARPWVDRLASAWLIKRFIDPKARFAWLVTPTDCPANAVGFDFDGAAFSHVGVLVTFEVLLASFSLNSPALKRLAALVHFLDAGGVEPPEALGVESVLAGLRASISDDDALLHAAGGVFEALLVTFTETAAA